MNEKFFSPPEEKQQAIINAGFRVFSQNTYITIEYMREYGCYDKKDLFDMMYSGMQVKIRIRLDLRRMYRKMYLASEGYIWEMVSSGKIDADKMEKDFTEIIEFWKSIFLRKGQTPEGAAKGE